MMPATDVKGDADDVPFTSVPHPPLGQNGRNVAIVLDG
jgi:hypothetical protein